MPLVDLIEGMKPIYETGAQGGPEPPQIKCGSREPSHPAMTNFDARVAELERDIGAPLPAASAATPVAEVQ